MAPTTYPRPLAKPAQVYFVEHGLCIPIFRFGKKRLTRLAEELATRSKDSLTVIVDGYIDDQSQARKVIKTLINKTAVAEWIERAETLAFGPHPETQLPSTKKADLIEALGLKPPPSAKGGKAARDAPARKRPVPQKAAMPTEEKPVAHSRAALLPKNAVPKPAQKRNSVDIQTKAPAVTQKASKRGHDSAAAPTEAEQTPAKKRRVEVPCSKNSSAPQMRLTPLEAPVVGRVTPTAKMGKQENAAAPTEAEQTPAKKREIAAPFSIKPSAPQMRPTSLETRVVREHDNAATSQAAKQAPAKKRMVDAASSTTPNAPPVSTLVLPKAPVERAASPSIFPPEQAAPNQGTLVEAQGPVLANNHVEAQEETELGQDPSTIIEEALTTPDHNGDACPQREAPEERFLKPGRHGRHGDFTDDPDLHTGRGHQVNPVDLKQRRAYEVKYRAFHRMWPYWPYVDKEKRWLGSQHAEGKKELDEAERGMRVYREKYQGELVGHLWPCGCVVPRDGNESEED